MSDLTDAIDGVRIIMDGQECDGVPSFRDLMERKFHAVDVGTKTTTHIQIQMTMGRIDLKPMIECVFKDHEGNEQVMEMNIDDAMRMVNVICVECILAKRRMESVEEPDEQ